MSSGGFSRRNREGLLDAISVGFFLVLIGLLFVINTNLVDGVVNFFKDIIVVTVSRLGIMLPQPSDVGAHLTVYRAAEQFSLVWGVFLATMLVVKFATESTTRKKAENIGDIVFWFGAAYMVQTWLIDKAQWFEFWAWIIMLLGISLVARAIVLAAARAINK